MSLSSGVAGGMAGIAAAIPAFRNFCSKAPPSGQFVFTGCHTNILFPATPLLTVLESRVCCFESLIHGTIKDCLFTKPYFHQKAKKPYEKGFPMNISFTKKTMF